MCDCIVLVDMLFNPQTASITEPSPSSKKLGMHKRSRIEELAIVFRTLSRRRRFDPREHENEDLGNL